MIRIHRIIALAVCAAVALATGCASRAWRTALDEDAPAAYYRFLRDHPDSEYTESAHARLTYHKIKRNPSLDALYAFQEKYPSELELLAMLRPMLEEKAFEQARIAGTAEAYDRFVGNFPDGANTARAAGNAVYVRADGFGGDPVRLAGFASEHPQSDFASEAERSAQSPAVRAQTTFDRVGLRVRVSPSTPEGNKLASTFANEAMERYRSAGVTLVSLDGIQGGGPTPTAVLTIDHDEQAVQTVVSDGEMTRPGVVATTRVTLALGSDTQPIWDREFSIRVDDRDHVDGTSLVLGPLGRRYWSEFFVPVSSWQSNSALRSVVNLSKRVTAVDSLDDRAVVAYSDGSLQMIDLADPKQPVVLARHEHASDFKSFDGVKILGDRVAVYGPDGIEMIRFTGDGSHTELVHERGTIGTVVAVEPLGDGLVMGSNRGLMLSDADAKAPMRVLRRDIKGVAVSGELLVFTDGSSVFVATLPLLRQNRVLAQLRIGREFDPGRVRTFGDRAVVMGETGALVLDLSTPRKPTMTAQLHERKLGELRDAAKVGDRIFLVGERGMVVLDDEGKNVSDSVDVASRDRVSTMGRHVVAIGDQKLQVLDGTPFVPARMQVRVPTTSDEPASVAPAP